jgi:hypothetical protein
VVEAAVWAAAEKPSTIGSNGVDAPNGSRAGLQNRHLVFRVHEIGGGATTLEDRYWLAFAQGMSR